LPFVSLALSVPLLVVSCFRLAVIALIGAMLSGRPEARYEAYARAYAGCGSYAALWYRRSYGRLYESVSCTNHASDDKFGQLWKEYPFDITGRHVRLPGLSATLHAQALYDATSGQPMDERGGYNPQEVWCFQKEGPFQTVQDLCQSFVFPKENALNEASFCIIDNLTDRVIGVIRLIHDDPTNLSIQLEAPIMAPHFQATQAQLEACFLLLDRLFAYGYRRVSFCIDAQDIAKRQLAIRLGFTQEGVLYKHMIVKDASRDSQVYGMLNSDWKPSPTAGGGPSPSSSARVALFQKLYGKRYFALDQKNELQESEYDEQQRVLNQERVAPEKQNSDKDKRV
jgi:RimJ/RimL family protein N-acetyltransferase